MIKIAVMGYGVVGSGVVELFYKNRERINKKANADMDISYILDIRDFSDSPYKNKFTKSFDDILNDDDVKIVVEVMGGINPAFDYVKQCMLKGKSVATSNKELVAQKGAELLKIAKDNNVNFLFEASVGGGIPIIRPISQCLAANEITEIYGILNGTTNYILTKMINDKITFDDALKNAQQLGYAERNPAADVEGMDSSRKVCILAALAFGKHVYPEQVYTKGITNIAIDDVECAKSINSVVKLIGRVVKVDDQVSATVYPAVISQHSQLAAVEDVYNAVMVRGDAIGDVVFYGRGAGKMPTASAVVADIIDCSKHLNNRKYLNWEDTTTDYVRDYKDDKIAMMVRLKASDLVSKEKVKSIFGDVKFIFDRQVNKEIAFVTDEINEKIFDDKIKELGENVISVIRMLDI